MPVQKLAYSKFKLKFVLYKSKSYPAGDLSEFYSVVYIQFLTKIKELSHSLDENKNWSRGSCLRFTQ